MRRARLEGASRLVSVVARLRTAPEDGATVGEYTVFLAILFAIAGVVWKLGEMASGL